MEYYWRYNGENVKKIIYERGGENIIFCNIIFFMM